MVRKTNEKEIHRSTGQPLSADRLPEEMPLAFRLRGGKLAKSAIR